MYWNIFLILVLCWHSKRHEKAKSGQQMWAIISRIWCRQWTPHSPLLTRPSSRFRIVRFDWKSYWFFFFFWKFSLTSCRKRHRVTRSMNLVRKLNLLLFVFVRLNNTLIFKNISIACWSIATRTSPSRRNRCSITYDRSIKHHHHRIFLYLIWVWLCSGETEKSLLPHLNSIIALIGEQRIVILLCCFFCLL